MRRGFLTACAAAALCACVKQENPIAPVIPPGAIVYGLDATSIAYHYRDTTKNNDYELAWLPGLGFSGTNCLALSLAQPTDTTGSFIFYTTGSNTGAIQRRIATVTDTVTGFLLPSSATPLGTHGNFAVNGTGLLTLSWANGTASRYFDPAAVMTLRSDTITSTVNLSLAGDSVHVHWRLSWLRGTC
jgi:hypothetical protein